MVQKIEESDRLHIVEHFSAAVEAGEPKAVLDQVRREICAQFCPEKYTEPQVNAVCSQVIIQRNRSKKQIKKLTETNPVPPVETVEKAKKIVVHPKSGAWADYENSPVKETWRQVESSFIDRHMDSSPEARAKMQILCTPGIKCYLEVRHLLKLGFKPENIVAIEREKKAWGDFEQNARELGLRPMFGELSELLPKMRHKFDIACIDFVNAGSHANLQIIENLPLAPRAVLAINVMAKRERTDFQMAMGRLHKTAAVDEPKVGEDFLRNALNNMDEPESLDFRSFASRVQEVIRGAHEALDEHLTNNNDMSWAERDTMLWYLQRYAGIGREDSWLAPNIIKNIRVDETKFDAEEAAERLSESRKKIMHVTGAFKDLARILTKVALPMLSLVNDHRLLHLQSISDFLNCTALGRRQIIALEKYRYNSKVGKTSSPFFTSLAVTELPRGEYQQMQHAVHFGLKFAESYLADPDGVPIDSEMDFNSKNPGFWARNRLVVKRNNKRVTSINTQDLIDTLSFYFEDLVKRYPLSLWVHQKEIPWKNLEESV